MTKMSLSFPRMRESISSSGIFPLSAGIPAFARMTKLEHFIFCHGQSYSRSEPCPKPDQLNPYCYRAQCNETSRLIAKELNLSSSDY